MLTVAVCAIALGVAVTGLHRPSKVHQVLIPTDVERSLVGRRLAAVTLVRQGRDLPETVSFHGQAGLLFAFRSDCHACQATEPAWLSLAAEAPAWFTVIGVAREVPSPGRPRLLEHPAIRLYSDAPGGRAAGTLDLPVVPVTLVVSPLGEVQFARVGILEVTDIDSIRRYFRRKSPRAPR